MGGYNWYHANGIDQPTISRLFNRDKIDQNRLLLILVTRSIDLSNTLYSVLLEAEGKFITLGREWIGSLDKYEQKSICHSELFASDGWFTDRSGFNNDECEYFGNGIINQGKIFVQNYVFDFSFEVEFYLGKGLFFLSNLKNLNQNLEILLKDLLEIEFIKQPARKQMPVTSNPFFAFHDDVFPAFAKNAVAQPRFPPSSTLTRSTIIPNKFFSSLEELNHISTIEMKLDRRESFELEISFSNKSEKAKIFELNFFDETTFLSLGACLNNSVWVDSDYFKVRSFLETKTTELSKLEFHFFSSKLDSYELESSLKIVEEQ